MNNKKVSQFADALREKLRSEVILKASRLGITQKGVSEIQEFEDSIVINGQIFDKEIKKQRAEFKEALSKRNYSDLIDEITYTWFNRFVALKFMSENEYLPIKVFDSKDSTKKEPDLLTNCLDINFMEINKTKIYELKSSGDDEKLYKFLILSLCNHLHKIMPFLFEKIQDYTELMFPEQLLRTDFILKDINEIIPTEDWKEVEIIGWLYQSYVSVRKSEVFINLQKSKKIDKQDIPAATQLFTPKWIVEIMVENSIGTLWLESNPNQELQKKLRYFIEQDYETPTDKIVSPEKITILDPAMGSGHMLVYAFEILYDIYKSQGYTDTEIPQLILNNNLYGLEIDNRATQLAGFAVVMKAREYDKNLFDKGIHLNLVAIQETPLDCPVDEKKYPELHHLWKFFYDAKNYGSILNVQGYDFNKIDDEYESFIKSYSLTAHFERELISAIIKQAKIMSSKYDVVVTNPPYMGYKGMNTKLAKFVKNNYPDSRKDLYTVFIEKCLDFTKENKFTSMITMHSWMFLSSYEKLRMKIIDNYSFKSMIHLGAGGFEELKAFNVLTTIFCLKNIKLREHKKCSFIRLTESHDPRIKQAQYFDKKNAFLCSQDVFNKIPRTPIIYWISEKLREIFSNSIKLSKNYKPKQGMATTNNKKFLRVWHEPSIKNIGFGYDTKFSAGKSSLKWFPYHKGGENKRWYGNNEYIVNYYKDGIEIKIDVKEKYRKTSYAEGFSDAKWDKLIEVWVLKNQEYYFKEGITWSLFGFRSFGVRYKEAGYIFDVSAASIFPEESTLNYLLGFLASIVAFKLLSTIAPTVNFQVGDVGSLPIIFPSDDTIKQRIDFLTQENINISKEEWNSRETSWDFKINELIRHKDDSNKLDVAYKNYCAYWKEKFFTLHKNEEELNQLFIDIYDLNDELNNKVPLKEITILKEEVTERKDNQLIFKKEVIVKQFLSYIVGCIFGRYNPEKEGLILANQGETLNDFTVESKFKPDDDNIIPITDRDYFSDDIVGKIKEFLKIYFGNNTISENLDFIASALKGSGSPEEKIRKYFLKEFYKDHIKTYKKKPIYWLFTSGKEQGFNTLIYMHRYNNELLAKMRIDYLHVLQDKIDAKLSMIKEDSKDREILSKQLQEMKKYDELLNHTASRYVEIDLDDGVTVNYDKFKDLMEDI